MTGGSGLLALNWAAAIRERQSVVLGLHDRQVTLPGVDALRVNLEATASAVAALDAIEPSLVVHTAGLTSVDFCESNPELAHRVNVVMAADVARACAQRQVAMVHISSDHLFSGRVPCVDENHPTSAINVYGRTKAEAELRVRAALPSALIIRTNFYGWGPLYRPSFSDTIVTALRQGRNVTLFDDVFYTPILAETLVTTTHELIARGAAGVWHVVGDDRLSKFDFGVRLADRLGLDPSLIRPTSINDRHDLVRRPRDMSLSNRKASALLGRPIGGVDADVMRLLAQESQPIARDVRRV